MSALDIVLIAVAAVVLLLVAGGALAVRRRERGQAETRARHIQEADRALEQARAADRGWDRALLEEAARKALAESRADLAYDRLDLVLVDDRPGVAEDRAHLVAWGSGQEARVILCRRDGDWVAERVE